MINDSRYLLLNLNVYILVHLPLYLSDNQEPVTEDTLYSIASLTKHFTTTLLGQTLKNSGKDHLNEK